MNQSLADASRLQSGPKSKGKSKASKIASVADLISKKSKDYGASLIEQARKEQAELNMRASSGVDPIDACPVRRRTHHDGRVRCSRKSVRVLGSKITSCRDGRSCPRQTIRRCQIVERKRSPRHPKGKGARRRHSYPKLLKDMFREQAENGVKTFKEALPLVGKLVRASGINATDAQIHDSYIKEPGVLSTDDQEDHRSRQEQLLKIMMPRRASADWFQDSRRQGR